MSQTSYADSMSVPFAGALGDYASDADIRSFVNEEASAAFPFGIAVCRATGDNGAKLMVDTNSKIVGLTVHTHAVEPYYLPATPAAAGVAAKGTASVLKKGRIWCKTEQAVVPGDAVYARYTAAAAPNDQLGALRKDDDTSKAKQISQAEWVTTTALGAVGLVDINMP